MGTWRVFTGLWGDFAWVDRRGLTWDQARVVLRDDLWKGYAGSHECDDCISQFTEAIAKLDAATPGQPVELTEIDGHDYLILRDEPGGWEPPPDDAAVLFIPAAGTR